ncbi:MAG: DUF4157 domain-containing protein [Deltaproteobacteria bacterium]|nr:DUF4157 domain-containing protein [Deltaproteobacteria bacterium]
MTAELEPARTALQPEATPAPASPWADGLARAIGRGGSASAPVPPPDEPGAPGDDPLDEAARAPTSELPHAAVLSAMLGLDVSELRVRRGPQVAPALLRLGAEAAERGDELFFADEEPDLDVVAHEVAHAVQGGGVAGGREIAPEGSGVEHEADGIAARVVAGEALAAEGPTTLAATRTRLGLSPSGAVHLLRLRRDKKGFRRIDDAKAKPDDINPARLSDEDLLKLVEELFESADYDNVVRVLHAVPNTTWDRIIQQHADSRVVIALKVVFPGPQPGRPTEGPRLGGEEWLARFTRRAQERHVDLDRLARQAIARLAEHCFYAHDPEGAAAAIARIQTLFDSAFAVLGHVLGDITLLEPIWASRAARRAACAHLDEADREVAETYRQLLHHLAALGPLDGRRERLALSPYAEAHDLPAEELRAVEVEPVVVAPHAADAPIVRHHDKRNHTATPEFVLCNTACELLLAQQAPPKTGYGFVANVPTIANGKDRTPLDIAHVYAAQAAPTGDTHTMVLVIGLNERLPGDGDRQTRVAAMRALAQQVQGFAAFPVVVVGFFWESNDIPYGLIRDTIKDAQLARRCVAKVREAHGERTYLHVGDSDSDQLSIGANLFDRHASFLGQQAQLGRSPDVVGGAYGFPHDPALSNARALHSLPEAYSVCMSMLLRDVGATVNPLFPYYAEANLLIKATEGNLNTSFGVPAKEGQQYLNNLKPQLELDGANALHEHFAFDFDLRVMTDARRQASEFRKVWGELVGAVLPRLKGHVRTELLEAHGLAPTITVPALALWLLQHPEVLCKLSVELGCRRPSELEEHIVRITHNTLAQCTATTKQFCNRMVSAFGLSANDQKLSNVLHKLLFAQRIADYDSTQLRVMLAIDPEEREAWSPNLVNRFVYGVLAGHVQVLSQVDEDEEDEEEDDGGGAQQLDEEALLAATGLGEAQLGELLCDSDLSAFASRWTDLVPPLAKLVGRSLGTLRRVANASDGEEAPKVEAKTACTALAPLEFGILERAAPRSMREVSLSALALFRACDTACTALDGLTIAPVGAVRAALVKARKSATRMRSDADKVRNSPWLRRAKHLVLASAQQMPGGEPGPRNAMLGLVIGCATAARYLFEKRSEKTALPAHLLRMLDVISLTQFSSLLHDQMIHGLLTEAPDPLAYVELERQHLKLVGAVRQLVLAYLDAYLEKLPRKRRPDFQQAVFQLVLGPVGLLAYCRTAEQVDELAKRLLMSIGSLIEDYALRDLPGETLDTHLETLIRVLHQLRAAVDRRRRPGGDAPSTSGRRDDRDDRDDNSSRDRGEKGERGEPPPKWGKQEKGSDDRRDTSMQRDGQGRGGMFDDAEMELAIERSLHDQGRGKVLPAPMEYDLEEYQRSELGLGPPQSKPSKVLDLDFDDFDDEVEDDVEPEEEDVMTVTS